MLTCHFLEKVTAALGFRNIHRSTHDFSHGVFRKIRSYISEQVLNIDDADYIIRVVIENGNSRISGFNCSFDNVHYRIVYVNCRHIGSVGHNIACIKIVKFENVIYHFFLNVFDNTFFAADVDHHSNFFFGKRLFICMRIVAEKSNDRIG